MIIILVNSLIVLQKYTGQAADNAIEKIRSETPIPVRAFSLPDGSIGIYNGETQRVYIKYLLLSNSTVVKRDIVLDPLKYTYIRNSSNIVAFITSDSHIIPVYEQRSQLSYKNTCLYLKKNITGLVGDGYLSRVYEYTIFPELNGFGVKKNVRYTYSRYFEVDTNRIIEGYRFVISPLFSWNHVKRYVLKGGKGIVYINLTDGNTRTENIKDYDSFRINVSSKLSNTDSVYLMPVVNRIVLDDEKAIIYYHLHYSTNLRRLYLYVNGVLRDTIRSNSIYSMGPDFNVILNKTSRGKAFLFINSTNLNYTTTIPYAYGTKIELRAYSELRSIDVNATIELYPSVVVIPPKELSEYIININGSEESYAVFEDPFRYYTLYIYPKQMIPLQRVSFWTMGNGTILNLTELGGNVILFYSYSSGYNIEITLGTLLSVIALFNSANSRYLLYYIVPILDEESYVTEIYRDRYKSLFHIETYENGRLKHLYTFSSSTEIYIHYPYSDDVKMYNYIPLTGNALLEYPNRLGNSNLLVQNERFNITVNERLELKQYGVFNGSITQIKLCLNSSLSGYLHVTGYPGTVFYLVKPPGTSLELDSSIHVSENYIISRIPDGGELLIPFTLLSRIPP